MLSSRAICLLRQGWQFVYVSWGVWWMGKELMLIRLNCREECRGSAQCCWGQFPLFLHLRTLALIEWSLGSFIIVVGVLEQWGREKKVDIWIHIRITFSLTPSVGRDPTSTSTGNGRLSLWILPEKLNRGPPVWLALDDLLKTNIDPVAFVTMDCSRVKSLARFEGYVDATVAVLVPSNANV